jgi:hypothetical protein
MWRSISVGRVCSDDDLDEGGLGGWGGGGVGDIARDAKEVAICRILMFCCLGFVRESGR